MDDRKTPAHGIATSEYVKRKLNEASLDLNELLKAHDNKLTLRSVFVAVGAVVVATASGVMLVDNRAAAQADAGVKVHESRIGALEEQRKNDRAEMNARLQRLEENQNADHAVALGTSQKVDKLLERFNVPNPAPTPKDAGP